MTSQAEARQRAIRETLLLKQAEMRSSARQDDAVPTEKSSPLKSSNSAASTGMFSNTNDAAFAQRIIAMRRREQDGTEPGDEESKVDCDNVGREALEGQKANFITRLYEDEDFMREKTALEQQIMQSTAATLESKNFIKEMDDFLKDLQKWKEKRDMGPKALE